MCYISKNVAPFGANGVCIRSEQFIRGSWPLGPAVRARLRCRPGRLACLTSDRAGKREARSGRDHGFHAKARRREVPMRKGLFFRQSPWAASAESLAGKSHPWPEPSSARRARSHAHSWPGAGGLASQDLVAHAFRLGGFSESRILGNILKFGCARAFGKEVQ
jgi:hypothetical protein